MTWSPPTMHEHEEATVLHPTSPRQKSFVAPVGADRARSATTAGGEAANVHHRRSRQGQRSPIFHGQAVGEEDQKGEIRKFFNLLDKGIRDCLGARRSPLVLAGVD